jgi:hypothetical protein
MIAPQYSHQCTAHAALASPCPLLFSAALSASADVAYLVAAGCQERGEAEPVKGWHDYQRICFGHCNFCGI